MKSGEYYRFCMKDTDKCFDYESLMKTNEFISTYGDSSCLNRDSFIRKRPPNPLSNCIIKVTVQNAKILEVKYDEVDPKSYEREIIVPFKYIAKVELLEELP